MIYYLPLEQYPERYTQLMSCPNGWAESKFKECGIDFVRVDGVQISNTIKNGVVLDAKGRSVYAMSQMTNLMINYFDELQDEDIVYTEDFWHPGIEALFYTRQLTNKHFKIGCFCHAQSVDDTDFTWVMRDWMRPIEQGYGKQYDFIFTCSHILRKLLIDAGVGNENNVFTIGLPFNAKRLKEQMKEMGVEIGSKDDYVLFSSRFDDEKDPMFFLDLVERCPDIQFKLVSPYKSRPPSRNPEVMKRLNEIIQNNGNLELVKTYNKRDYYQTLANAKVQFNCAHQDWVSWTLVEASMLGCSPLYPVWKDFGFELSEHPECLYEKRNLDDAEAKLRKLMSMDCVDTSDVYMKHDRSWNNYIETMRKCK